MKEEKIFILVKTMARLTPEQHKDLIDHLKKLPQYEWAIKAETAIK